MMERKNDSRIFGWFHQYFTKPKNESISDNRRKHVQNNESSSGVKSPSVNSSYDAVTHTDCNSPALSLYSFSYSTCSSQGSSKPFPTALNAPFRLTCRYDVCVCHSEKNISQAHSLVSFLESPSRGLRCYLQTRDSPLGGAVSTELCNAVQSSHCWVLLISPNFLQDDWCLYQMHQVICEGPMSQRIIPAVLDMHISEIPHELRFFYTVDLNRNHEAGYAQVYRTVLQYLKDHTVSQSQSGTEDHVEFSGMVDY
ncbi:toll/interleukin-1 receptor domain-containing adapter protein isoform X2 [Pygocentrus nattereri]|uniref:TIR domain-containing protein n=1 Tax=Pygocentrus nattereri TaxID=42514 RepID=A0A3B4C7U7_PYGNA|nr:toll/interleukin-1 receptor domain-containing adapter protein isoform X2 [Pygocentrus nattereri]XP_037395638.1 toll/interleukin-1 receptor domain-containing adapter protein isoform X2 [Pygocentrus nattereri]